jgi:hypothetical protein
MYELCEAKDISIKAVERLIKESAVDCALFYDRNRPYPKTEIDGSRDCDYQSCEYKCDGIHSRNVQPNAIDYSTYNLYYKSKTEVSDKLVSIFEKENILPLLSIMQELRGVYSEFDVISELKLLITTNTLIKNKVDIDCYLRERKNVYFLVDAMTAGDDFLSNVYARRPVITDYSSPENAAIASYIESIQHGKNIRYCFDRLPITYKIEFIEKIIENEHQLESDVALELKD